MAKELRTDLQAHIDAAVGQAEYKVFNSLRSDFSQAVLERFIQIKDQVEDWTDAIALEAQLRTRLQTIAAKATYTENNLIDMALISCMLWNIVEVE